MSSSAENANSLVFKWNGSEIKVEDADLLGTIGDLKNSLFKLTQVPPQSQKLIGIKGKLSDDRLLSDCKLNCKSRLLLMGQSATVIDAMNKEADEQKLASTTVNDLSSEEEDVIHVSEREENLAKVSRRVSNYKIENVGPIRKEKKLLVLDVDYTLFDHKSSAEHGVELMRPFLHDFLTECYEHFDIVIWSATSMVWIKAKLEELGITKNDNYKIAFVLDSLAMISVFFEERKEVKEVKPLSVIWGKYPHWNETNSILIDDVKRNFAMCPRNGLRIEPFRNAHANRVTDRELVYLKNYLCLIAMRENDFSKLKHRNWRAYIDKCNSKNHIPK